MHIPAPEISVLLPVRDGGAYLAAAVDDVLRQEGVTVEVVAVDDGSRDASYEWLERRARSDARLLVSRNRQPGAAAALNQALAQARGELIGQMEADDRCSRRRFRLLRDRLQQETTWQGVTSGVRLLGHQGAGMERYIRWQNQLVTPAELAAARFVEIPALHQTGLYRRQLYEQIGAFNDDRWPLDIDFWMRVFEQAHQIGKVEARLYAWRQHPRQTTRTQASHELGVLRECKCHYFVRGLGPDTAVDLLATGTTRRAFEASLRRAGAHSVGSHEWRPGEPLPPRRAGCRLFVFGMAPARQRIRTQPGAFEPGRDWFAG